MGHASFLIGSDILWFNYVLRDIYKILKIENEKREDRGLRGEVPSTSIDSEKMESPKRKNSKIEF